MHEMSLVRCLLRQVEQIAGSRLVNKNSVHKNSADNSNAAAVREVTIELGPLSGVESDLVTSAYKQLINETSFGNAELIIQEVPLVIRCLRCRCDSSVNEFIFRCSHCGSGSVQVIRGDEFRLVSITVDEGAARVS